jgi:hypothetical protein
MKDHVFSQTSRSGLGNKLLPWARGYVFSRRHNLPMLAPSWNKLRIGPILRGEEWKTRPFSEGLSNHGYVRGLRRLLALALLRRVTVESVDAAYCMSHGALLTFSGLGMPNPFECLVSHVGVVRAGVSELASCFQAMVVPQYGQHNVIGVHVRGTDFQLHSGAVREIRPGSHVRTPLDWFPRAVAEVRRTYGDWPVRIYGDLSPAEGRYLCERIDRAQAASTSRPIVDLIQLSNCCAIVGSSGSTFSMWAAFLSQRSIVWYPGGVVPRIHHDSSESSQYELDSGGPLVRVA